MSKLHQIPHNDYTVGWVCALPIELAAARRMLDETHKDQYRNAGDTNLYTLGRINGHNVVVVCLPYGQIGTNSAAAVAAQMKSTFPSIEIGLMVGIGGGIPSKNQDIRLGDVVVSRPGPMHGGVIQYDFGKTTECGFQRMGYLNSPPVLLLNAVAKLEANRSQGETIFHEYSAQLNKWQELLCKATRADLLFEAKYRHVGADTCEQCDKKRLVERKPRDEQIMVHYGTIASGNQVMRDAIERDRVSSELGDVLCFEMEAAGLMNTFPCLVIRGICDYADSHKNKDWQAYAAGTAAVYAKTVLSVVPPVDLPRLRVVDKAFSKENTSDTLSHLTYPVDALFNSFNKQRDPISLSNTRVDVLRKKSQETQNLPSILFNDVQAVSLFSSCKNQPFKTFTSSFNDAPVDLLSIHFIERERELNLVRNAHQGSEENAPIRCAIWGIPGVGKTQLAIRYTKIFLEDATVSAVFWMSCSNVEKLQQGFSKLLNLIDHPDQFRPEQSARVVAARRWLEQPEVSGIFRWLLVLDNVDITTLGFLRENLPRQGKQGRILITTRTEAVANAVCKASGRLQLSFELEPPVMGDAIIFFLKSVGVSEGSMSSASRRQVTELIDCLGRLPFAVEHAASYLSQSPQTIDSLTRLYRGNERSNIFNWQDLFSAYETKSISGMFASHLHNLKLSSPEVLSLLNILVFWDPDRIEFETVKMGTQSLQSLFEAINKPLKMEQNRHWARYLAPSLIKIPHFGFAFSNRNPATDAPTFKTEQNTLPSCEPESLIKLMSSEVQLQSALQQLQMLSFIKQQSPHAGGAYCMHDLTQTLVQVALESEGTHLQWLRCSVRIACGAFHRIENPALPEVWHRCEGLISHILSLTKHSKLLDDKNADLLIARTNIAAYWCNRGRYYEAREIYQQMLGIGSDTLHGTGIETNQLKLGLAEVNWHLGKHSDSILLYDEVRRIRESQLGAGHADVLHIAERMALVYRSQARYAEARSMLESVLESRKTSLGPDHLDTIRTVDNLATAVTSLGEYAEAETLYKQALVRRGAQLGTDHPDTLWTADNLATNYRDQGRHLEALELYERVLEGRKLQLGDDHPQTLWTLTNIAMVYASLGHSSEAEVMYKQAIVGNEQRLGHDHQETLWAVEGLADVYHQQAHLVEAISLYNRALRGREDHLGVEHPSVMRLMHKLANLYRDRNELPKSIALFERLLENRKSRLSSGHPDMLRTYHDAATSYAHIGNYIEAEHCYRLELTGSIKELGSLHTETKKREQNLISFLREQESQGGTTEDEVQGAVANKETSSVQQSLK